MKQKEIIIIIIFLLEFPCFFYDPTDVGNLPSGFSAFSNLCLYAYRFLKRQVVWYSHLFQNFPQIIVIHAVKSFGIVNKAEIDVFL